MHHLQYEYIFSRTVSNHEKNSIDLSIKKIKLNTLHLDWATEGPFYGVWKIQKWLKWQIRQLFFLKTPTTLRN